MTNRFAVLCALASTVAAPALAGDLGQPGAANPAAAWIAATRAPVRSLTMPVTTPAAAFATPVAPPRIAPLAAVAPVAAYAPEPPHGGAPAQLSTSERDGYRAVFAALRAGRVSDAATTLAAIPDGLLHPVARAELILAKSAARADPDAILLLLATSPELPEAGRLAALARARGATSLPALPVEQGLTRTQGASKRGAAPATAGDVAAAAMSTAAQKLIVTGRPADAEALFNAQMLSLSVDAQTEWQQRIAWGYYITGDDASAARMAGEARKGMGPWAVQADWVAGLAAWRRSDCATASDAFAAVARRARDAEMMAAGLFWAARADMACGRPQLVAARLRSASRMPESFYGLLAGRALGLATPPLPPRPDFAAADWTTLAQRSNARVAVALVEIGELSLADRVLRHQAAIGAPRDHPALLRLASQLNLPATQFWLAHNAPAGSTLDPFARYPSPQWAPANGWRVDRSLVFAHALQESAFSTDATSRTGARGLMQLMPATAKRMQAQMGSDTGDLTNPAFNIECGQRYLEELRDQPSTGGLLPKVIAAYNAGPMALPKWNMTARDDADPLLYIESIPYVETRGYVVLVLRNYWMYQREAGQPSASLTALAQGLWPKFPGLPGATSIRPKPAIGLARAD